MPSSIQLWINGTSAWQWGHQCATKMMTLGLPSAGSMVTLDPSKDWPTSLGASSPTAGSVDGSSSGVAESSGYAGRSSPETVTVAVSWLAFLAAAAPVSADTLSSPPPRVARNTTNPMTTTTATVAPMMMGPVFLFRVWVLEILA